MIFSILPGIRQARIYVANAVVAAIFGVIFSTQVQAQSQQASPWQFKIEGGGIHQSDTDLTDGGGSFAVDRWFVSAGFDYGWSARDSIGVSVGGGRSDYTFDEQSGFGGGNPWGEVEETRVTVTWRAGFGDRGLLFIVPTVRFNGESDAGSGDSVTYGLYAAAAWRVSDGLTIGPGLGVFSRLENSARIFPLLAIDWDISDRWNLSTGSGLAASRGPGLTLRYKLNEDWSLGLTGRYEDLEFRLDDKGLVAGGVGRHQSLPLVFSARLVPDQKLRLGIFAGIELGGNLKLKNATGDTVDESDYDPAPVFGATFELNF